MSARLPLTRQRLVVVTGKGGVGKSAVTAALAQVAARAGRRTLAVEVGRARVAALLGASAPEGAQPRQVAPKLWLARASAEEALGGFVKSVLRLDVLARRLLESTSFQVLAAAAPGLAEFLVLHQLQGWLAARKLGRLAYDLVLVDAPASGHSLPLLAAPRTFATFARIGPVAEVLATMQRQLLDPAHTLVCVVTTPEELAVRETIELHRELAHTLGLPTAPPIVNALPPRRFAAADEAAVVRLAAASPAHPHLAAARFEIDRRHAAAEQVRALRRALGAAPVTLPFLFAGPEEPTELARLADDLADATGLAA